METKVLSGSKRNARNPSRIHQARHLADDIEALTAALIRREDRRDGEGDHPALSSGAVTQRRYATKTDTYSPSSASIYPGRTDRSEG